MSRHRDPLLQSVKPGDDDPGLAASGSKGSLHALLFGQLAYWRKASKSTAVQSTTTSRSR
jgi:hypothetical protein